MLWGNTRKREGVIHLTNKLVDKEELPDFCPVCGEKNNGKWAFLCIKCWMVFVKWSHEKYPNDIIISDHIPEYLAKLKEKVEFT